MPAPFIKSQQCKLNNKLGFTFSFKFGISGLLLHMVTTLADKIRELLEYMDVHDNDASESSQLSWRKIVYVGEVGYSTSLSMVCVKYSAYVRRIVADFLHKIVQATSKFQNLLKIEMLVWGKLIQKLCQKGVYEESFSRHAAWIEGKLI
ncbi:hypothetical protein Tco_1041717 [Tanacetum coccineum]|uniref:Uncharacterized protein n=1 Tax=Tanacetum coccineum TaxID=301880 RepID=A0ABQ5GJC1_9ASTR